MPGLCETGVCWGSGTHPEQPLPTGYTIVGQGDCLGCALGVCCNYLGISILQEFISYFTSLHVRRAFCLRIHCEKLPFLTLT